ncbi:MAG: hypothetical protein GWN01_06765, partial [Nitrosopumilaceae archaeon]|nr:hypothetical protein [Nitrosopumilaceae archaeon]NIX61237.1 hypothetical protein [Nitrosopumilaceae archaeon]
MKTIGSGFSFLWAFLFLSSTILFAGQSSTPSAAGMSWADKQDADFEWIAFDGGTQIGFPTDDDTVYSVTIPFTFNFYDIPFTSVNISSNGYLTFSGIDSSFFKNDSLQLNTSPDS